MISAADFASSTPPPRIIGSECEYGVQFGSPYNDGLKSFVEVQRAHSAKLTDATNHTNRYFDYHINNGGRLYVDLTAVVEYASPESLGPEQAMLTDFAGIFVMRALAKVSKEQGQDVKGIYRRSGYAVEENGVTVTTGYHENYLVPNALKATGVLEPLLSSYIATRHIWAGGGFWSNSSYYTNQKMVGIGGDPTFNNASITREKRKPFYKHAAPETGMATEWSRLEIRCADPLQSPTLRYLGFAATSLTLRLIEHRFEETLLRKKSFRNSLEMLQRSSANPKYQQESIDRNNRSALDFQRDLLDIVCKFAKTVDLPQDEKDAIPLWRQKLDAVERYLYQDDIAAGDEIEWVTKERFINRATERDGTEARAIHIDMLWDQADQLTTTDANGNIVGKDGLGMRWWQHQSSTDAKYFQEAEKYVTRAPAGTRAVARERFLHTHGDHGNQINVGWNTTNCFKCDVTKVHNDPYGDN